MRIVTRKTLVSNITFRKTTGANVLVSIESKNSSADDEVTSQSAADKVSDEVE